MQCRYSACSPAARRTPSPRGAGNVPHGNLSNSTSADSWTEGFASWFAAAVAEYKGEDQPHQQVTNAGKLNRIYGNILDNPYVTGEQLTHGGLAEEFAIASVLWDVSESMGAQPLIDLLEGTPYYLENFFGVYLALRDGGSLGAFLDGLPCDFFDTGASTVGLDCLFTSHGFYHELDGDGRFGRDDAAGVNEEVGRTRWPLAKLGPTDFRPHIPLLGGSLLRLSVADAGGGPVPVSAFEVQIEYDPPLEAESSSYTRYVAGDGPYELGILVPGVSSRALITPVTAGTDTAQPMVIESDFFHDRVNPFRTAWTRPSMSSRTRTRTACSRPT